VLGVPCSEASSVQNPSQPLGGTILINIRNPGFNYQNFRDFAFTVSTRSFQQIAKGRVVEEERNGLTYSLCQGSKYETSWNKIRGIQKLDDDEFEKVFGQYDLSDLRTLRHRNGGSDCDRAKSYQLRKGSRIGAKREFPSRFSVNEQRTHAVYNLIPEAPSLLIDLVTMTVSKAFCNKWVNKIVWDKSGRYVAYTSSSSNKVITVTDIKTTVDILEKPIGRYVFDIAWSPSSNHLAVLSCTSRMGFWPWEIFFAAAGHPVWHNTFYLSLYDTAGKELLTQEVVGNIANGRGSLVWIDA
jgi:hypothetical protein